MWCVHKNEDLGRIVHNVYAGFSSTGGAAKHPTNGYAVDARTTGGRRPKNEVEELLITFISQEGGVMEFD